MLVKKQITGIIEKYENKQEEIKMVKKVAILANGGDVSGFNASVSFGGTSIIIIVSVILETIKQIESQMLVRNYRGFLND